MREREKKEEMKGKRKENEKKEDVERKKKDEQIKVAEAMFQGSD